MAEAIDVLFDRVQVRPLTPEEAEAAVSAILDGRWAEADVVQFLSSMHARGESPGEVAGCVRAMVRRAVRIPTEGRRVMDLGGTGGDGAATFNISTTAALVVAAAGHPVIKHGNAAVTGTSGSLDLLRELGIQVPLTPDPELVLRRFDATGFAVAPTNAFLRFPPELVKLRQGLSFPTIFNLAGPLAHPATALAGQVVGAARSDATEVLARALAGLGRSRATVLHGSGGDGGGLDEPSLTGPTKLSVLRAGTITTLHLLPEDVGLQRAASEDLAVATPQESAAVCRAVLGGRRGPPRDVVIFTAGIALWTVGATRTPAAGVQQAADVIDRGQAQSLLDRLTDSA